MVDPIVHWDVSEVSPEDRQWLVRELERDIEGQIATVSDQEEATQLLASMEDGEEMAKPDVSPQFGGEVDATLVLIAFDSIYLLIEAAKVWRLVKHKVAQRLEDKNIEQISLDEA